MKKPRQNFTHDRCLNGTDEWLTPPEIVKSLGSFDLDPCAPEYRPVELARCCYTIKDDGLAQPWIGRVWLNPPYGRATGTWLRRLADCGNGIALVFARTETDVFFEAVWPKAHAMLFLRGRLKFYHRDGTQSATDAGAPSVLIAYGENNAQALHASRLVGRFIRLKESP